jgi:hypothetical protein
MISASAMIRNSGRMGRTMSRHERVDTLTPLSTGLTVRLTSA